MFLYQIVRFQSVPEEEEKPNIELIWVSLGYAVECRYCRYIPVWTTSLKQLVQPWLLSLRRTRKFTEATLRQNKPPSAAKASEPISIKRKHRIFP
jgi:hypothetical protein